MPAYSSLPYPMLVVLPGIFPRDFTTVCTVVPIHYLQQSLLLDTTPTLTLFLETRPDCINVISVLL
jgi:hypothetical protein